jgi:hypothetical protein
MKIARAGVIPTPSTIATTPPHGSPAPALPPGTDQLRSLNLVSPQESCTRSLACIVTEPGQVAATEYRLHLELRHAH